MATLSTTIPLNMDTVSIWYGVLQSYSPTSIVIRAGSVTGTYRGSFSYDVFGNVYGQLYSYTSATNGVPQVTITNINRDAFVVMNFVNSGNMRALQEYVLNAADVITGSAYRDILRGYTGNDRIDGAGGNDVLYGGLGNDVLRGSAGNDFISGDAGTDTLLGGSGADMLVGGSGRDIMSGGVDSNRDVFIFQNRLDTPVGVNRDQIMEFTPRVDDIDLRPIDANVGAAGNQAFAYAGSAAAHSIWTVRTATAVLVRGDVNGDRIADFEILVSGSSPLVAGDFLL